MHKYIKKFLLDCSYINDYYNYLVDKTKSLQYVGITNEWLIDNYYLIVEYKKSIYDDRRGISKKLSKSNNIYEIILNIVKNNEYNINYKTLVKEINSYQRKQGLYFSYKEISAIPEILLFIYISRLADICKESYKELIANEKVTDIVDNLEDASDINVFINKDFDIINDSNYVFEINNQLKKVGVKTNLLFKEYNLLLEKNNISIREVLSDEYQKRADTNLLTANIFNNIKEFVEYDIEDLYESINKCEKYLMDDKIYYNMTPEAKYLYRERITKLAHKKRISELTYIENLLTDIDLSKEHIGFRLFKNKSYKIRMVIYVIAISIISFLITLYSIYTFFDIKLFHNLQGSKLKIKQNQNS